MSNLMNLVISSDETSDFMAEEGLYQKMHQDKLSYSYVYVHNTDINEGVKRPTKEIRYKMDAKGQHLVPDVLRYPHGAPSDIISDIIIKKVFS